MATKFLAHTGKRKDDKSDWQEIGEHMITFEVWNFERADQRDAYRIERLPSREDLDRLRLKNLQPPRPLQTAVVRPDCLRRLRPDRTLRGYQIRAMDEVTRRFDDGRRTFLLEMATGIVDAAQPWSDNAPSCHRKRITITSRSSSSSDSRKMAGVYGPSSSPIPVDFQNLENLSDENRRAVINFVFYQRHRTEAAANATFDQEQAMVDYLLSQRANIPAHELAEYREGQKTPQLGAIQLADETAALVEDLSVRFLLAPEPKRGSFPAGGGFLVSDASVASYKSIVSRFKTTTLPSCPCVQRLDVCSDHIPSDDDNKDKGHFEPSELPIQIILIVCGGPARSGIACGR